MEVGKRKLHSGLGVFKVFLGIFYKKRWCVLEGKLVQNYQEFLAVYYVNDKPDQREKQGFLF